MNTEPGWTDLDRKEKTLCHENGIKPKDYLMLKKKIVEEQEKNKAISKEMLSEKGKDIKGVKDKLPTIFDFWIRSSFLQR